MNGPHEAIKTILYMRWDSQILNYRILSQNPVIRLNNLANEGIQSDTILDYRTAKSSYITE